MIAWQWCRLDELTTRQQYAIFAARESVFVVEQNCAYQDLDGVDFDVHHLVGWSGNDVAAYLRVFAPGEKFKEPALGRVLTTRPFRRTGLGHNLMQTALEHIDQIYPCQGVRISAQIYLGAFYRSFGFEPCSGEYMEDGIPHVEMLRP